MRIWTSYYAAIKSRADIDSAVTLVQVSNTKPDWFPYNVWVPDIKVCPSWKIIDQYKSGNISYDQFTRLYIEELNGHTSPEAVRNELIGISNETGIEDIALLCWEKTMCHRFPLAEWIGGDYRGELT